MGIAFESRETDLAISFFDYNGDLKSSVFRVIVHIDEANADMTNLNAFKRLLMQYGGENIGFPKVREIKHVVLPNYSKASIKNFGELVKVESPKGQSFTEMKSKIRVGSTNYLGSLQDWISAEFKDVYAEDLGLPVERLEITAHPYINAMGERIETINCMLGKNAIKLGFEVVAYHPEYRDDCSDCHLGKRLMNDYFRQLHGQIILNETDKETIHIPASAESQFVTSTTDYLNDLQMLVKNALISGLLMAKVKTFKLIVDTNVSIYVNVASAADTFVF